MPSPNLILSGEVIKQSRRVLHDAGQELHLLPKLIIRIIREEMWKSYTLANNGKVMDFDSFAEFVVHKDGLRTDLKTIKNLCRDEPEALDAIDHATQNPHGGNRSNFDNIQLAPTGTSRDAALRRLRKDAPELHQRVLNRELSAHAAMVEAGFRRKPTPLEQLKRSWLKASDLEQSDFREWIDLQ